MLLHASPEQHKEIYAEFYKRRDIFPHIRADYIKRMVEVGHCVFEKGVIITYQQYKKDVKMGNVSIPKGSIMLHQILNTAQFSGAGREIFDRFFTEVVTPLQGDLYLSVRADNIVARSFYKKVGMIQIGEVDWQIKGQPLPGVVYLKYTPRFKKVSAREQKASERKSGNLKLKSLAEFFV